MSATGFTKARSMGPVAEAVEREGGSAARVFRRAELPLRLIDEPDQLILLKDQLTLVECAARELGDETLPLRLSAQAGMAGLGAFGRHVSTAPSLRDAITRCNEGIASLLQSTTHLSLSVSGDIAKWTYEISDSARVGRQKNELLAFGYMADALHHFSGDSPMRAELPRAPQSRSKLQDLLGCEISIGERAALIFPSELLRSANPGCVLEAEDQAGDVPTPDDFVSGVSHLLRLALLERRPTIERVCRRLGMSRRTLQRRLAEHGAHFDSIKRRILVERADVLLRSPELSITDVAYELGYSDPAHFTRAISNCTGETPRARRRRLSMGRAQALPRLPRGLRNGLP
jgi:AraC-like DNA-binding protein